MLKDVLKEIFNAKAFSISLIAKNLNISEGLVEDSVKELLRMGYIIEDMGSPTCDTPCSGCAMKAFCNSVPIKIYAIADKGKKLLKNI
ncbi:MAG: winged helix-turn-helix transcriptional regulator [Tissierellales bacterium]